jgi:hypothetical protein
MNSAVRPSVRRAGRHYAARHKAALMQLVGRLAGCNARSHQICDALSWAERDKLFKTASAFINSHKSLHKWHRIFDLAAWESLYNANTTACLPNMHMQIYKYFGERGMLYGKQLVTRRCVRPHACDTGPECFCSFGEMAFVFQLSRECMQRRADRRTVCGGAAQLNRPRLKTHSEFESPPIRGHAAASHYVAAI